MKKIFLLLLILILFFSQTVLSADFIFNENNSDSVVIVSEYATVKGQTKENYIVKFGDETVTIDEEKKFEFDNVEPGEYILKVLEQNDNQLYKKEIVIEDKETVNLGEILIDKSKKDGIELTEYESPVDFKKAQMKDEKENKIEGLLFENQFSLMNFTYNKNISLGDNYRSSYSSDGYLNEIKIKLPVVFNDINLQFGLDYGTFSANSGDEVEYLNGTLNNRFMVDFTGNYVNLKTSLAYDMEGIGRIRGFLGQKYYKNVFDKSIFGTGTGEFYKDYYDGKGLMYGVGFDTYFGKYTNTSNPFLDSLLLGFEYSYSNNEVDVSSTTEFSSFHTTGYKSIVDFYIGYRKDFDVKIGYKKVNYFVDEFTQGVFYYPSMDLEMSGVYFSLGKNF